MCKKCLDNEQPARLFKERLRVENEDPDFDQALIEQLEWEDKWIHRLKYVLEALLFGAVLLGLAFLV